MVCVLFIVTIHPLDAMVDWGHYANLTLNCCNSENFSVFPGTRICNDDYGWWILIRHLENSKTRCCNDSCHVTRVNLNWYKVSSSEKNTWHHPKNCRANQKLIVYVDLDTNQSKNEFFWRGTCWTLNEIWLKTRPPAPSEPFCVQISRAVSGL